jgi:transposase-like protein
MTRVPPSERIGKEIEELLNKGLQGDGGDLTSNLVRLGAQRLLQELLEQELTEFLGRGHYQRRAHGEELRGYRNGYEQGRVRTAEGEIPVYIPQARNTPERFESVLLGFLSQHTDVLERLVVEMYARGLSTRDIEDAFRDATGKCLMTKTGVSQVTEVLHREYEAFIKRELGCFQIVYLFLDAVYEPLRRAGIREGILCAWGVTADGMKVLLHMTLGNKESHSAWLQMLRDMVSRGLRTPLTVTSDGAPGLIRAVQEVFPLSLRVRCWAHKMRNVLDKVPDDARAEVKAFLEAVRDAPTHEAGQEAAGEVLDRFGPRFPSAMRSLSDDLEASLAHLKVPVRHRKCVRTTNLIERSFVEERRRTKTLPYFMTEKSCLKLVFATLWRASVRWQRIRISELEQKQMAVLARTLGIDPGPGGGLRAQEAREETHSVA